MKTDEIKQKMIEYFAEDKKRIDHALRVAFYAEKICKKENGDRDIVITSAYLHDIGIPEAVRKYNSSGGNYQEKEGPPVARSILNELNCDEKFIIEICEIIGHHHSPGIITTNNFQILYESDWLVNLGDDFKDVSPEKKSRIINSNFKTESGKRIAYELYLDQPFS